jgi:hypothetical protein
MKAQFVIAICLFSHCGLADAQEVAQEGAVQIAEKFIAENGYTDLPSTPLKQALDLETVTFQRNREELLQSRYNSLKPKAIGVRNESRGSSQGWSVAFDYNKPIDSTRPACRVVTMNSDGSEARVEHVDGMREYFVGFGTR